MTEKRHEWYVGITTHDDQHHSLILLMTPEEKNKFFDEIEKDGTSLTNGRGDRIYIRPENVKKLNARILKHCDHEENMKKSVHNGDFEQCYKDGTPIPKKYYCNLGLASSNGIVVSAHLKELIGHKRDCNLVEDTYNLCGELMSNILRFRSGGIGNQEMTPPRECSCRKSFWNSFWRKK